MIIVFVIETKKPGSMWLGKANADSPKSLSLWTRLKHKSFRTIEGKPRPSRYK